MTKQHHYVKGNVIQLVNGENENMGIVTRDFAPFGKTILLLDILIFKAVYILKSY